MWLRGLEGWGPLKNPWQRNFFFPAPSPQGKSDAIKAKLYGKLGECYLPGTLADR